MRKLFLVLLTIMFAARAWSQQEAGNLVLVKGGVFQNIQSSYYGKGIIIPSFYIGKYEITQKEWTDIMGSNPSKFKGDNMPVQMVSWYDAIEYCNKRSAKEGLKPYYNVDKNKKDTNNECEMDNLKWTVTTNAGANGYRLPTEPEWEYAAGGGQMSKSFTYSGANKVDKVAWYWKNSGDAELTGFWNWSAIERNNGKAKPVGDKEPNELGLYDMSGNVREWCWEWYRDPDPNGNVQRAPLSGGLRLWKGGSWMGGDFCCELSFRAGYEPNFKGSDQGLRVCRSK